MTRPVHDVTPRIDRVNRVVLGLLGLLALSAGVIALCVSFGAFGDKDSRRSVLAPVARSWVHDNGAWFWPVAAVAAGVVALLGLWWLIAQTSTSTVRRYRLPGMQRTDSTTVHGPALLSAVCDEIEAYPGVRAASGTMAGSARRPLMRLTLDLEENASPGGVRRRVEQDALRHARQASGLDELPIVIRLTASGHTGPRVQ
jgi:hypothetical protein